MHVQTVDFKNLHAANDFIASLRSTGFVIIKNHPLKTSLIQNVFKEWAVFFASPEKYQYLYKPYLQKGYFPFKTENAKGYALKDLKEFYHYYADDHLPNLVSALTATFFKEMEAIALTFLKWIEEDLPTSLQKTLNRPLTQMLKDSRKSLLRIIHYPPLTGEEEEGAVRAHAHEDIDLLTILPAASATGLQVLDLQGKWHNISCEPNELVINAGDMLQMLTQNYYISTTHQVINPQGEEARKSRYSMPLFLHLHGDVKLSTTHTAQSYLEERLNEIGLLASS